MTEFYSEVIVTENDYGHDLTLRCRVDNSNFDLTDYTVKFTMVKRGATTAQISKGSCTVTDASAGEATYTWVEDDLDTVGIYDGEVEVTKTGIVQTFRGLKIIVAEEGA